MLCLGHFPQGYSIPYWGAKPISFQMKRNKNLSLSLKARPQSEILER
jgi:hypothetical protein